MCRRLSACKNSTSAGRHVGLLGYMIRCTSFVNYGNCVDLLEDHWRRMHAEPTIKPSLFQNLQGRGKNRRKEKSVAALDRSKQ